MTKQEHEILMRMQKQLDDQSKDATKLRNIVKQLNNRIGILERHFTATKETVRRNKNDINNVMTSLQTRQG